MLHANGDPGCLSRCDARVAIHAEEGMAKKRTGNLASRYLGLLSDEGYRPKLEPTEDKNAVIVFKSEGDSFVLFVDEEDESFFHLGTGYEPVFPTSPPR